MELLASRIKRRYDQSKPPGEKFRKWMQMKARVENTWADGEDLPEAELVSAEINRQRDLTYALLSGPEGIHGAISTLLNFAYDHRKDSVGPVMLDVGSPLLDFPDTPEEGWEFVCNLLYAAEMVSERLLAAR
jgi:hypothetical protein